VTDTRMKTYSLKAQPRTIVGRKVKHLRTQGFLPATVYGKKVQSASVQVSAEEFRNVYSNAGETGLVELTVGRKIHPVLIHNVQLDPVTDRPIHVEFLQVDLKEKVKSRVPVELTGEAPAVARKVGVLLTLLDEVEVEALPADLPEKITVDVSRLADVDQELKVRDLTLPAGVTLITEPGIGVVKVGPLISKEAEAEAAAEAKAAAEAQAAAAAEAVPPEGVPKAEETTKEERQAKQAAAVEKTPEEKKS